MYALLLITACYLDSIDLNIRAFDLSYNTTTIQYKTKQYNIQPGDQIQIKAAINDTLTAVFYTSQGKSIKHYIISHSRLWDITP